jgi:hypothetical protein
VAKSGPKPQVRIGVLTLHLGDEDGFIPGPVHVELNDLIMRGVFDFSKMGSPYAASPDGWVPFGDTQSILQLLKAGLGDFDLYSDSANLASDDIRLGVNLFIIDPLVLLHRDKAVLAALIQEHIISRKDKAFCIIVPQSLPEMFRKQILDLCTDKFNSLKTRVDATMAEFEADKPERLSWFLRRVSPYLRGLPNPARLEEARQTLANMRVPFIELAAPTIGGGTA